MVEARQTESIESRARENRDAQQALVDGADAFGLQLAVYTQAKTDQAERLADALTRQVARQAERARAVVNAKPRGLASLWRGDAWRKAHGQAQSRLRDLEGRLARVQRLQADTRRLQQLAEARLRRRQPALAHEHDARLHEERLRHVAARQAELERRRQETQTQKTGRGRSLSRDY